ncbi:4'-phosphopantetheinyl transferase superfamily protein [Dyella dinghuensis]|uniref:4'-phosphopantetheinyl transferase superfamily protein n=1 Tax=Dyella dinghuensis TaxID=1920169 RepID=A0A432LRW0_9GAMM|nr:4'-phosphopantetheinyl transferase superfamily protein [Dyella dinghuensis]RUL63309.1 4'-phosphopantetheinyl transferase superfamily protein [Dyella dinghuensis]
MRTTLGQDVAGIAACLDNDVIHVWLLDYRRELRREPLKALLGVYLGLPAEDVILHDDEHGRPELATPWNSLLQFNWSHSGGKALIAIARGIMPGIDIERFHARPRALDIAERFFHPRETAALTALDDSQRERAFVQLWTGKEAVVKALGRGIAFGLQRFCISVPPAPAQVLWLDGEDAAQWQLHALDTDAQHVASLAWRGPSRTIAVWTLAEAR